jgi:hypothetical protein
MIAPIVSNGSDMLALVQKPSFLKKLGFSQSHITKFKGYLCKKFSI